MLVIGLLSYILILVILVKVNFYIALGFIVVTSIASNAYLPQLKGYVGNGVFANCLKV